MDSKLVSKVLELYKNKSTIFSFSPFPCSKSNELCGYFGRLARIMLECPVSMENIATGTAACMGIYLMSSSDGDDLRVTVPTAIRHILQSSAQISTSRAISLREHRSICDEFGATIEDSSAADYLFENFTSLCFFRYASDRDRVGRSFASENLIMSITERAYDILSVKYMEDQVQKNAPPPMEFNTGANGSKAVQGTDPILHTLVLFPSMMLSDSNFQGPDQPISQALARVVQARKNQVASSVVGTRLAPSLFLPAGPLPSNLKQRGLLLHNNGIAEQSDFVCAPGKYDLNRVKHAANKLGLNSTNVPDNELCIRVRDALSVKNTKPGQ